MPFRFQLKPKVGGIGLAPFRLHGDAEFLHEEAMQQILTGGYSAEPPSTEMNMGIKKRRAELLLHVVLIFLLTEDRALLTTLQQFQV